ncbi:hypothetical protein NpNSSI1_00005328 [Neofusicoccum parvum]|nr:hypothetical protein NpNSSI1_00005328 [Neofusicoccum parvum]
MVATVHPQQSVAANYHSTQRQNAIMAGYAACSPSMAAQNSQQQNIVPNSYPQYHPTASNYQFSGPTVGTFNNSVPTSAGHSDSNAAFGDTSALNSNYTNNTRKRKSPDAESAAPNQHGTPTPQSSRPTKRAKPTPHPQSGQPISAPAPAPAPNPAKRKRPTTTPSSAPAPKRAKHTSPPTHHSKPVLLSHLAHAPWATPTWQTTHLRATLRTALTTSPQPFAPDPSVADAPAFWTALARCGRDWASDNWQRTQLTATGRAAVEGAGREMAAAAEAAERWEEARKDKVEVVVLDGEEGEERARARRAEWVGGRPKWVYGMEVWNREDWKRAEYSLAAGSMLSGGGKAEAVADQYVGMKRGTGRKTAMATAAVADEKKKKKQGDSAPQTAAGKEKQGQPAPQTTAGKEKQGDPTPKTTAGEKEKEHPTPQTTARQEVQGQAEGQSTGKITILQGLPDYPDHY